MTKSPYCNSPPEPERLYLMVHKETGKALCNREGESVRFSYKDAILAERLLKHRCRVPLLTAEDMRGTR